MIFLLLLLCFAGLHFARTRLHPRQKTFRNTLLVIWSTAGALAICGAPDILPLAVFGIGMCVQGLVMRVNVQWILKHRQLQPPNKDPR